MPSKLNTAKDVATQAARGWAAGLAGLPGDIEGLARMLVKYGATPGSYVDRNMSDTPRLPTSDFYREWLPGGDWETPEGALAQDLATAFGGVGVGGLTKPAVKGAKVVGKAGLEQLARAVESGHPLVAAAQPMYVVKPKGGNWLAGSAEGALKRLKTNQDLVRIARENNIPLNEEHLDGDAAINDWVDKQLTRYVKNEMATPEDPVRALAERGVLHVDPSEFYLANRTVHPSGEALQKLGQAPMAKQWENISDNVLRDEPASALLADRMLSTGENPHLRQNPWLAKVPPETRVNRVDRGYDVTQDLGFDHLIDELRNATNPASGLPRELLLKYESLPQVSVPQAVERVAKINEWRAAQKAQADLARANNAATVLHKEYPDKGFKWVELKPAETLNPEYELKFIQGKNGGYWDLRKPGAPYGHTTSTEAEAMRASNRQALEDALKYEGKTMGHCVGGYCPDVLEGRSRIFSLRNAKGEPHVTIEVKPKPPGSTESQLYYYDLANKGIASGEFPVERVGGRVPMAEVDRVVAELKANAAKPSESIVQIKGKANRAPNPEYLPYVQDFVKSGQWSDVGDLSNAGLRRTRDAWNENELKKILDAGHEVPDYLSPDEIQQLGEKVWPGQWGKTNYAQGGAVTSGGYNPARVDEIMAQLQAELAPQ